MISNNQERAMELASKITSRCRCIYYWQGLQALIVTGFFFQETDARNASLVSMVTNASHVSARSLQHQTILLRHASLALVVE